MAMRKKAEAKTTEVIEISEIKMADVSYHVLGTSPMIQHRFLVKSLHELLLPSVKLNRASLEQTLKHDPMNEYRGAFYFNSDPKRPTLFHVPNGAFHGALASAALDIPGAKRAQIERLTKIIDVTIDLYGIPQIFSCIVRNSDIGRTPDVRTRPIFPQWACKITVSYMSSILSQRAVTNLLAASGVLCGIGDWRSQKGGPFGAYKIVTANDRDFKAIVAKQGRVAQQKAYDRPAYFDADTEELLTWFETEVRRREMEDHLADDDTMGLRTIRERGGNGKAAEADAGEYIGQE